MKSIKMFLQYSLLQLYRTPIKTIMGLTVMGMVCVFLCVGFNLRQTVKKNIHLLKEEFDVVAVPNFSGSVDKQGKLIDDTTDRDYAGYLNTYAEDFDLSVIENASGVNDILVHKQFGAYLSAERNLIPGDAMTRNTHDIVIFTYDGDEPLVAEYWDLQKFKATILWSARGYHEFPKHEKGMKILNAVEPYMVASQWREVITELEQEDLWRKDILGNTTGTFILQPGQTYIASVYWEIADKTNKGIHVKGGDRLNWMVVSIDQGHSKQEIRYENGGFYAQQDPDAYQVTFPCIMPYTEDFWETEAGAYFRDAAEICKINGSALTVVSTEDMSAYLPFHQGGVYLSQGRNFTEEDYANGNKVCIVSKYLADQNGWKIGHKLDMFFFEANYGFNVQSEAVASYYEPLEEHYDSTTDTYSLEMTDRFFDEGTFEIVGFYSGNVTFSDFSKDIQYTKDEGIDRRIIFVPQASVENQPDVPLSKYNTSVLLDDELFIYFMSDMETSGLLEQQKGRYQLKFDIYDQGLGAMKQSLRQLDVTSKMVLYVACAVAITVIILLSVLTILQNRKQIAILRSLGVEKKQIPMAVLSGFLIICLLGAIIGGGIAHLISNRVADYILDTVQTDLADTSFTSTLAKKDADHDEKYAIAIQSQPVVAVLTSASVWIILALLCGALILREANQSPMLRLGTKE